MARVTSLSPARIEMSRDPAERRAALGFGLFLTPDSSPLSQAIFRKRLASRERWIYRFGADFYWRSGRVVPPRPVRTRSSARVASLRCPILCSSVCEYTSGRDGLNGWNGVAASRIVGCAGTGHGDQHRQEAVGEASQGPAVAMPLAPQGRVIDR